MFGGRGFGGTYFAQAGGFGGGRGRGAGGIGGSGFPPDWSERMFGGKLPNPFAFEPDDDLAALLLLDLL